MNIKAVLFDLDGTLADTALDLGAALNALLEKKGLPAVAMEKIRPIASHGARGLIELGLGMKKEHPDFAQIRKAYLAEYEACFDVDTVLFDDINKLIKVIDERGLAWGIITNKPKVFAERLVPKLGFITPPAVLVCGDTTDEPKPSTKPMFYACEKINIAPENCLYVGDAERDIEAGRKAGMKTVLVNWGYIAEDDKPEEWGADYVIDEPLELCELL